MMLARVPMTALVILTASLLVGTRAVSSQQATTIDKVLGQALHLENVESDFPRAIELYKRVIADPTAPKAVLARALVQLGGLSERLGLPEARPIYERILKEPGLGAAAVAVAKARLAAMQEAAAGPRERIITTDRYLGGVGGMRFSNDGRRIIGFSIGSSEWDPLESTCRHASLSIL